MIQRFRNILKILVSDSDNMQVSVSLEPNSFDKFIFHILSFFYGRLDIKKSPSEIETRIIDFGFGKYETKFKFLEDAINIISKSFELHLRLHNFCLNEIRSHVTEKFPLILFQFSETEEIEGVFGLIGYNGFQYRIVNLATNATNSVSEAKLLTLLKINSDSQKIKILSAEPHIRFVKSLPAKDKTDRFKNAIKQIFYLIQLERKDIWIITIYGIGIGILALIIPVSTSTLVDVVTFGVLIQPVVVLTLLMVTILGFAGLMQIIQTFVIEILQRRIFVRIALDFSQKFPQIRKGDISFEHKPELANRFFDSISIQKSINLLLVDGLAVLLTTIIGLTLIATYHPLFLLFDAFLLFFGVYFIIYNKGKNIAYQYLDVSKEKYKVAAWIEEIARHDSLFQSNIGRSFATNKMDMILKDYLWIRNLFFQKYIRQIIGLVSIQTIASGILLGIGGYLVIERQLTIGQLVAAEIVISKVLYDFSKFGKHLESFYSLVASVEKISSVLSYGESNESKKAFILNDYHSLITIQNITYTDLLGNRMFENFSCSISEKKLFAVSSDQPNKIEVLFQLLLGQITPDSGEILLDFQDFRNSNYFVTQSAFFHIHKNEIVAGDIIENIRLGDRNITQLDILNRLDQLGATQLIQSLPDGLKTRVATSGYPLNPTVIILIQLLRILLHQPKIVLIDRILDQLDEELVDRFLEIIRSDKKINFLILHTNSDFVYSKMDKVLSLDEKLPNSKNSKKGKNRHV